MFNLVEKNEVTEIEQLAQGDPAKGTLAIRT